MRGAELEPGFKNEVKLFGLNRGTNEHMELFKNFKIRIHVIMNMYISFNNFRPKDESHIGKCL
jgi:hypothetical protein